MSKFRLETRPSVLIIFLRRQFTLYFHSFFYTTSQYIAPRTCWILMDSEQLFISKMQTDLLLLMIRCRSHDSCYKYFYYIFLPLASWPKDTIINLSTYQHPPTLPIKKHHQSYIHLHACLHTYVHRAPTVHACARLMAVADTYIHPYTPLQPQFGPVNR